MNASVLQEYFVQEELHASIMLTQQAENALEWSSLFKTLDTHNKGFLTVADITHALQNNGLDAKHYPILKVALQHLPQEQINLQHFTTLMNNKNNIISRGLTGSLAVLQWQQFCNEIGDIFEQCRYNTAGKLADYIPQLAEVDPNLYALSICTVDGQRFNIGDFDSDFTIQSCGKPFLYAIACEEYGVDAVHEHVGYEPSGGAFNAFTLDERGKPHNPMINAGSLVVCSLLKPELSMSKKFLYASQQFSEFAGGARIGFDNSVFLSEKDSADRNFALAYYMKENNVFPPCKLEEVLDFYFQMCSVSVNTEKCAVMAATLANGGTCPLTDKKIVSPETVKCVLQLMYSCGMYDFSGEWACTVGLPAKSGVAGAVCVVIPSVMGICIYSPKLDKRGNSVRAVEFCTRASQRFKWSIFDHILGEESESDETEDTNDKKRKREDEMLTEYYSTPTKKQRQP